MVNYVTASTDLNIKPSHAMPGIMNIWRSFGVFAAFITRGHEDMNSPNVSYHAFNIRFILIAGFTLVRPSGNITRLEAYFLWCYEISLQP